mmetsp:Transcript_64058/g.74476  ORF Transcript_64058/g.74476 Transcript_64058/m.74476 type:complete len:118 (-) Transcript_64058:206-559(-)
MQGGKVNSGEYTNEWNQGLFGCFGDMGTCFMAWCCPCIQFGQNKHAIDNNNSCFLCGLVYCLCSPVGIILQILARGEIRDKYKIKGSFISDCLCTCCCGCCTLAQEGHELKHHNDLK